jgi:hypothetical protein
VLVVLGVEVREGQPTAEVLAQVSDTLRIPKLRIFFKSPYGLGTRREGRANFGELR